MFKFNEAVSMTVECESQEEINYYFRRRLMLQSCRM
jgi:predicted 3-demethylubiquinone-9 3-methyltransferase (glyoxalase superfamily)